ncbi:protein kinase [Nostoc sp. FACHB-892]|uniref:protein kinase domain-containing protein n=1 Tax=Nostoc sp. FACHB-892 TaxID=2692843 RepID=UPI00168831E5|nr:protein kinase [Nostoc sp. FACHB-892]
MIYSPNFNFLRIHEVYLVEIATLAERYFQDDPLACLTKLRRFGELLAQLVAAKLGIYVKSDEDQYRLLKRLKQDGCIPQEVYRLFEQIRWTGNQAIHGDLGDHQTALDTLQIAWNLGIWFHQTFSNNPNFKAGAFIPPPDPHQETEALKRQLEALRKEAQANRANAEIAQAQLIQEAELRQLAEYEAQQEKLNAERIKQQLEQMQILALNKSAVSSQKTHILMSQAASNLNLQSIRSSTTTTIPILCLNPDCDYENPPSSKYCINCSSPLILNKRYIPIRFLGQGGFGRTFEAIDINKLGTRCVIKQLLPTQQGTKKKQEFLKLFEREAQQLNNLGNYPNIPNLLAFFEENEHFYLIQEFIEGNNLYQEILELGKLSEQEVKILLEQLLEIIQFIHKKGVIHRDIKPENIIKRQDGSFVLIDFGISKDTNLECSISSHMATLVGTPGYAPIEQLRGRVYPCSDLYALGVTAIRLLTGIFPGNGVDDNLFDENNNICEWRKYCKVSNKFAKIIDKMLTFQYQERYQTATEVMQELSSKSSGISRQKIIGLIRITLIFMFLSTVIIQLSLRLNKFYNPVHGSDVNYQTKLLITGQIQQYKRESNKLTFTLLTKESQSFLIVISPNLLNQVANAPPPYGLIGKTVNVTGVQPLAQKNTLLLQIQKPEQLQINL